MNNVILMGRLTRDPELSNVQGSSSGTVARFSIAVDKQLSREKKTRDGIEESAHC